jgi:hypothetical protein
MIGPGAYLCKDRHDHERLLVSLLGVEGDVIDEDAAILAGPADALQEVSSIGALREPLDCSQQGGSIE